MLIILSFTSLHSVAKDSPDDKNKFGTPLELDTVIVVEGIKAKQIYDGLKIWFAESMRSSNNVIQLDNKETAHIIGKANLSFKVNHISYSPLSGIINFTIDVQARDGRFRLKMYEFAHKSYTKGYGDGWSEGLVYINGKPRNLKGGHGNQYSQMQKRAVPIILNCMDNTISAMRDAVKRANEAATTDNW